MLPKWTCGAILGGLLLVCSLDQLLVARVGAEEAGEEPLDNPEISLDRGIELSEYDYEDHCKPVAQAEWQFLQERGDSGALGRWEEALIDLSKFKKKEKQRMKTDFKGIIDDDSALGYKLSVIQEPGDALLNDTDYEKLVKFIGKNRVLRATSRYSDGTKNLTQEEVEYLLSHNGEEKDKLKVWATWHQQFSAQVDDFPSVLQLAQKAAELNDQSDVKSYWEMLTGESNAYETFKYQLDRLTDLRVRLVNFARKRLAKKYDAQLKNDSIPAHLLGSLAGNDWTHLAFDVVPHPDVMFDIRQNLWEKKLMGKYLYKSASSLGKRFLGQQVLADFWTDSNFRAECPTTLVNFCELGKIRVSTCNEPSLTNYLTAHKNVAKALLHQMSSKVPILNDVNRYSVMEEAVAELFSILAASPAWLQNVGLLNKSVGSEEAKMTSLAITALDVLPRLAYYASADKWRLEAVESNETDAKKLTSDWWKYRLQNELIYSAADELPTFLSDDYVISNKPYLSKVLGIVLAFQMYGYIMKSTDIRHEPFDKSSFNSDLVRMVQNNSENWKTVLDKYMGIDSISTEPMSDFFGELDYYFESYEEPEETYDYNAKEIELEQLEKRYRKIANAPTTTTTTTTTTRRPTGRKTTKPIPKDSLTLVKSGSTAHQPPKPTDSSKPAAPADQDTSFLEDNEALSEDGEAKKPKINTSKAVWAVAAVLVATVTICVIAIFGRRRCNRTPKNRRYV